MTCNSRYLDIGGYLLATPQHGLQLVELQEEVPRNVAGLLLGSATFSFHARRVVFCEGDTASLDYRLYRSWFSTRDTVVRSVGSSDVVLQCVAALNRSGIATGLSAIGLVDRDAYPNALLEALPEGVSALPVHEVESVLCIPEVVKAVASHLGRDFNNKLYFAALKTASGDAERHKLILERWKRRLEPRLEGLLSAVRTREDSIEAISASIPDLFDKSQWGFSPEDALAEERALVETCMAGDDISHYLQVMPGKALQGVAARFAGIGLENYHSLIFEALRSGNLKLESLHDSLVDALAPYLPARTMPLVE